VAGYNANAPAAYTATGTFTLPAGVLQTSPPTSLSVSAQITVDEFVSNPQINVETEISIYPNPAKDMLYYQVLNADGNETLEIYSIYGTLVRQSKITEKGNLDISDLSSGIYLIKFKQKFIKLSIE
jgi:hypothetical protein